MPPIAAALVPDHATDTNGPRLRSWPGGEAAWLDRATKLSPLSAANRVLRALAPADSAGGQEQLRFGLVVSAVANLGLNVALVCFNFVTVLLLTHWLGVVGYGAYAFALAAATLLAVPAIFGLSPLLIRAIATYRSTASWGLIRGILRRSNQAVLISSVIVVGLVLFVLVEVQWPPPRLQTPAGIALLLVPLLALVTIRQSAMQGLNHTVLGRIPETLVSPTIFILLLALVRLLASQHLTASAAVAANVLALACAMAVGAYTLRRVLPGGVRTARPLYETRDWARQAVPLVLFSGIVTINSQFDVVLLGALTGPRDAGIYSVASRIASLVSFFFIAAAIPLMPAIARLYASGERTQLERVLAWSARGIFFASLPLGLAVIVFAQPLMSLFGAGFGGSGPLALRILAVGQLVNVATGFAGTALVMTGHASLLTKGYAIGAAFSVILNAALIPPFGLIGAAIATAIGISVINIGVVVILRRRLSINALPFGRLIARN